MFAKHFAYRYRLVALVGLCLILGFAAAPAANAAPMDEGGTASIPTLAQSSVDSAPVSVVDSSSTGVMASVVLATVGSLAAVSATALVVTNLRRRSVSTTHA